MVTQRSRHKWSSAAARRLCSRAGDAPDIPTAVLRIGEQLLEGVVCPPTDLEEVARRLGVGEITSSDIGGSGELHKIDNRFAIVTAEDLSPARKRFTIAHELGHVLMDGTGTNAPRTGRELERLCDMIATELLMPAAIFQRHLPEMLTLSDIWRLSREFEVSFLAAAYRCVELTRISIIEVANQHLVNSGGPLRVQSLRELDAPLQNLIRNAKGRGEANLYLSHDERIEEWHIEYQSRGPGRTFLLLCPMRTLVYASDPLSNRT